MAEGVTQIWPIGTDCKVTILGVKDDSGAYINDGVVTGSLKDASGNAVANATGIEFLYVADSDGNYEAVIPNSADLLEGREYTLHVTAEKDGIRALAHMTREAQYMTL